MLSPHSIGIFLSLLLDRRASPAFLLSIGPLILFLCDDGLVICPISTSFSFPAKILSLNLPQNLYSKSSFMWDKQKIKSSRQNYILKLEFHVPSGTLSQVLSTIESISALVEACTSNICEMILLRPTELFLAGKLTGGWRPVAPIREMSLSSKTKGKIPKAKA